MPMTPQRLSVKGELQSLQLKEKICTRQACSLSKASSPALPLPRKLTYSNLFTRPTVTLHLTHGSAFHPNTHKSPHPALIFFNFLF